MRACVRLEDGECSDMCMFDVKQEAGYSSRVCSRAFAVQHVLHGGAVRVAEKRLIADVAIMASMVQLQRKKGRHGLAKPTGGGGRTRRRPMRCGECRTLLRALCQDHQAGGLERMVTVIVTACDCVRGGRRPEDRDHVPANEKGGGGGVSFRVTVQPQPGVQTNGRELVYFGGAISASRDLSDEVTRAEVARRLQRAWACFGWYKMEICDLPGVRLQWKARLLKAEVLETMMYGCVTWSTTPADCDSLRTAHHSGMLLRCLGLGGTQARRPHPILRPRVCQVRLSRALKRRCADEGYCSLVSWHA